MNQINDLPLTINQSVLCLTGNKQTDPTARSALAHVRCTSEKAEADEIIYGKTKMRRAKAGQPLQVLVLGLLRLGWELSPMKVGTLSKKLPVCVNRQLFLM